MTAILSDKFKFILAEKLFDEVTNASDSHEYYIGIGKSDAYGDPDTPVDPLRTLVEERELRNNLQSVKKVAATSFVASRYNWTSGSIYNSFNDAQVGVAAQPYYVLTDANEVYICLQQGKNAAGTTNTSTVKPNFTTAGVSETQAFETADGYRWKLLYSISATKATDFLSSSFIPVEKTTIDSASANAFQLQQLNIQNLSTPKQIIGTTLVSGGSGYTSAPTVSINGNGSGAAATATISGGQVVKVEMNNESAALGSGYDYASIAFSGGGGAGADFNPIITSDIGIGNDPRKDLKSSSIMLNTKPNGTESGTFIVDQDFRQIGVFRDLEIFDSSGVFSATSGLALRFMKFGQTVTFAKDDVIRGPAIADGSRPQAHVVDVQDSIVYYTQNDETGFTAFTDGTLIDDRDGSEQATVDSANRYSIVDQYSGDVLYIENRNRVVRSTSQTEDIKVVITV